jgi:hypothetical protein
MDKFPFGKKDEAMKGVTGGKGGDDMGYIWLD